MKRFIALSLAAGLLFAMPSPTHGQGSLKILWKVATQLNTAMSIYERGKKFFEDLGWTFWKSEGVLSITTDRKDGVVLYSDGKKFATAYRDQHANYKVPVGTYSLVAYDRKKKKKWESIFTIEKNEITELTFSKDGWKKRKRNL